MVVNEVEVIKQSDLNQFEEEGLTPNLLSSIELLKMQLQFDTLVPRKENVIEPSNIFYDFFRPEDLDFKVFSSCLVEPIILPVEEESDYQKFAFNTLINRVIEMFEIIDYINFDKAGGSLYLDFIINETNLFYKNISNIELKLRVVSKTDFESEFEILNKDLKEGIFDCAFKTSKVLFNTFTSDDFSATALRTKEKFELLRTLGFLDLIEEKWHFSQNGTKVNPKEYPSGVGNLIAHILFSDEKDIKKQAQNLRKYYSNFVTERNKMGDEHRNTPYKLINDFQYIKDLLLKIGIKPN
jgi:hypothetical protein